MHYEIVTKLFFTKLNINYGPSSCLFFLIFSFLGGIFIFPFSGNYFDYYHFFKSYFYLLFGCSMLLGQCPMNSLLSACGSVPLSVRLYIPVCPSLSFFKIGSLVFSGIVHDDSWPWHLVTDRARILTKKKKKKKKKLAAWIWVEWAKIGTKTRGF